MPQNYLVKATYFGSYQKGNVIPEHEVMIGHNLETLIAAKVVEPTALPINIELKPRVEQQKVPSEDLLSERNRLFTENESLKQQLESAIKQGQAIARDRDTLEKKIAESVLEVEHLKRATEEHQSTIAAKEAEIVALKERLAKSTEQAKPETIKTKNNS